MDSRDQRELCLTKQKNQKPETLQKCSYIRDQITVAKAYGLQLDVYEVYRYEQIKMESECL